MTVVLTLVCGFVGVWVIVRGGAWIPRRVRVARLEHAVITWEGRYERLLRPGAHWVRAGRQLRRLPLVQPRVEAELARSLLADPAAADALDVIEVPCGARAALWFEGRAVALLDPGRHALWAGLEVQVERLEVGSDGVLRHPQAPALLAVARPGQLERFEVELGQRGYLYRDGALCAELSPGDYAVWRDLGRCRLRRIEVRPHTLPAVRGLLVTCADRVEVTLDLDLDLVVEDPRWAAEAAVDSSRSLARQAEVALRAAVGRLRVEALLASLGELEAALRQPLEGAAERLGWRLIGLRGCVVGLPEVLTRAGVEVLEAEQAARVERVRRREETAATRSQLNTARLVASCPTLLRLKELDAACAMAAHGVGVASPRGLSALLGARRR